MTLACGDDADNISCVPLTVANKEKVSAGAHAQQQEGLFASGVLFVKELNSEFVVKDGLRFVEGNAMFPEISCCCPDCGGAPKKLGEDVSETLEPLHDYM